MMKSWNKDQNLMYLTDDVLEVLEGTTKRPISQDLVNKVRVDIMNMVMTVSDNEDLHVFENLEFSIPSNAGRTAYIVLKPKTELGTELIKKMEGMYGFNYIM